MAEPNSPLTMPEASENSDNPKALVDMAVKYEHAEGVQQDYKKAVDLYCRAARLGYADAQYALGWMYANGRGVPKDDGVAAQLFAMAAEQGHQYARVMMRYTKANTTTPLPACLLPEKPADDAYDDADHAGAANYPQGPIVNLVHQLAPRYEVDPKLALAIISVESAFNVRAISPKNAQGLMQLIPETAQRFRVKNAFDPAENIKGGLAYLKWLLSFFRGNVPLVAAAYNAGEGAVERYRGIPPYPETRDYVKKVTRLYRKPTHPYQSNATETSSFAVVQVSYSK
ncbi:lytic transglycosylase [Sulfurimicrobium lacus]|uniref:Lytic transglycosylase n=1 Tax=Sulfurimicrobium lacus TaxID=2715678 RepID=A0A6F8VA65_9PROT|nr:transglycosylase SLT domain-containing protein [Sulfurimicrobium lacus]BCB26554.1 lytic transglycosylase [Sulfurimicrobium lacus]